jgi:hypothetical protein
MKFVLFSTKAVEPMASKFNLTSLVKIVDVLAVAVLFICWKKSIRNLLPLYLIQRDQVKAFYSGVAEYEACLPLFFLSSFSVSKVNNECCYKCGDHSQFASP